MSVVCVPMFGLDSDGWGGSRHGVIGRTGYNYCTHTHSRTPPPTHTLTHTSWGWNQQIVNSHQPHTIKIYYLHVCITVGLLGYENLYSAVLFIFKRNTYAARALYDSAILSIVIEAHMRMGHWNSV